jgi:hypothetical protein
MAYCIPRSLIILKSTECAGDRERRNKYKSQQQQQQQQQQQHQQHK